ncbi:hypothetical protein [Vibrio sp. 3-2(1)]|uniref:hypothetical protein n=1 Tax=Vibrio sp. 3-2(1) TaxID=2591016 RepID=UPI0014822608|nr:hypothetical protein [Vibrio sp. 3-2(1)]NNN70904.1 hypothetical protein [Vibrio sp. 3-2(1)]
MKKFLLSVFLLSIITGCTSARISRNLSSGVIGCPAKEIVIKNERASFGGLHTWEAECKGHQFICSYQETTGVHCIKPLEEKASTVQ